MTVSPTILILAGKRDGKLDPLAERAGVSHKCKTPIQGKPLLQWVLEAVGPAFPDSNIIISIHEPDVIADIPAVVDLQKAGRLHMSVARANIVESVEGAIADSGASFPLLITTGDNVLVTREALHGMRDYSVQNDVSAALAVAGRESVMAAHPEGQRNYYEFRDIAIANCNMYWLKDASALAAAEAFREGGQFMKNRARIANAFGLFNLLRFRFGWFSLKGATDAMSRKFGVKVGAYVVDDGAYAIDVDNERTYDICEELLAKRKPQS